MSTLNLIEPRGEVRHDVNERRHQLRESDVMTGAEFRQRLGWGRDRFFAAVKAGRFDHLRSVNLSTARRVVYVRAKVLAWIQETPTTRVGSASPRQSRAAR